LQRRLALAARGSWLAALLLATISRPEKPSQRAHRAPTVPRDRRSERIRTAIMALSHDLYILKDDVADPTPVKQTNTDLARFTHDVLLYDGGVRAVWSLAHLPNPPFL